METLHDKISNLLKPPAEHHLKVFAAVEGLTPTEQDRLFNFEETATAVAAQIAGMDLGETEQGTLNDVIRGIVRNHQREFNTSGLVDGLFNVELRTLAQEAIASLKDSQVRDLLKKRIAFVEGNPQGKWFQAAPGAKIEYDRAALEINRESKRFAVEVKTQVQTALYQVLAS